MISSSRIHTEIKRRGVLLSMHRLLDLCLDLAVPHGEPAKTKVNRGLEAVGHALSSGDKSGEVVAHEFLCSLTELLVAYHKHVIHHSLAVSIVILSRVIHQTIEFIHVLNHVLIKWNGLHEDGRIEEWEGLDVNVGLRVDWFGLGCFGLIFPDADP